MKANLYDLDKKVIGSLELDDDVFALEVRPDLIKLVVDWQLAKRRSGTHCTKTISEVSGTTKKPFKQKGTGRARQGSLRQVHMRGGGVSHGPLPRNYEYALPKKVRKLGLMHALSAKVEENALYIVKNVDLAEAKTKFLQEKIEKFEYKNFLIIDDSEVNKSFSFASKNLFNVNALPQIGANVYDIVKHECLIITEEAVKTLTARLK